jgi:3-methyladenine DNA glycosylase AlkD
VAEKAYLKSELEFLGVGLPLMREAVRGLTHESAKLDRRTLLALVRRLWGRPIFENRMMAVLLLEAFEPQLAPDDLGLLERMIRESKTWALVDELAITVAGPLVERHPRLVRKLDGWSTNRNFWVRRAALLALLRPLRRGDGDFDRFSGYADRMLDEREFFIRKAIGWVLRETSKKRPLLVYEWLLPRCDRASGITLREAVRWLSPAQRGRCATAYRRARRSKGASFRELR